jgi:hypothetical protein
MDLNPSRQAPSASTPAASLLASSPSSMHSSITRVALAMTRKDQTRPSRRGAFALCSPPFSPTARVRSESDVRATGVVTDHLARWSFWKGTNARARHGTTRSIHPPAFHVAVGYTWIAQLRCHVRGTI